jgi:replicative superfamily II helicase
VNPDEAPTGSGKTLAAELALWSTFRDSPRSKVVYIAPLKALVRERVQDWGKRLCHQLGRTLVELTGDFTPDLKSLQRADIIITTPEKWCDKLMLGMAFREVGRPEST